jgi:trk system potassium uptake protein TrkH
MECHYLTPLAHSFTTISTGGFSTHNNSFAYFNDTTILNIAIIFMIIGSFPFLILAQSSFSNITSVIRDHQIQLFLIILTFCCFSNLFFCKKLC